MKRPSFTKILVCFGIFVFFLFVTFPYQKLRSLIFKRIYDVSGITINADSLALNLLGWPGVSLRNATVSLPTAGGEIVLNSKTLVTRARLAGFLPPIPAVSLALDDLKGGGDVFARLAQSGDTIRVRAEASKADLAQIAIPGFPEPIPGVVNMDGDLIINQADLSKSSGSLDLDITKLSIPALNLQGIILPVLNFGDVKTRISIKNGVAEILNFKIGSKGSDISGTVTGEMKLGQTIQASALNLTLKLSLSAAYVANPQGATLVSLLESYKNSKGEYGLRWNATIQDMMVNVAAALPQKVE